MPFTDDDREKLTEMHTIVTQSLVPTSKDHENRLRSLEKNRFKEAGAVGAVGAFLGYIGTHFIK